MINRIMFSYLSKQIDPRVVRYSILRQFNNQVDVNQSSDTGSSQKIFNPLSTSYYARPLFCRYELKYGHIIITPIDKIISTLLDTLEKR